MPLDYARATFVQNEYRRETVEDFAVKAIYPIAVEIDIDTQLSSASAASLAGTMFTELKKNALAYEVMIDGVFTLDMLDGSNLLWTITAPAFGEDGTKTYRLVSFESDDLNETSKLVLRG